MFWSAQDLQELKGTSVVGLSSYILELRQTNSEPVPDKIGKEEAEKVYNEKLAPAIQVQAFTDSLSYAEFLLPHRVGQTFSLLNPYHTTVLKNTI